ncbi:MAG: type II toxin-antitoxin system prevent-host-death family antitoxin [Candidatus Baltobacteraceae bacterium]
MGIRRVGAREANQGFSALIRGVEDGDTVIITRRGRAIVKMERAVETPDPESVAREIASFLDEYASPVPIERVGRAQLYERVQVDSGSA